jgi:hypothetical protein
MAYISALFIILAMLFIPVSTIWTFWVLYCNDKNLKQRQVLLHLEIDKNDRWKTLDMHSTVTYEEHLSCLTQMRNPYKLYKLNNSS